MGEKDMEKASLMARHAALAERVAVAKWLKGLADEARKHEGEGYDALPHGQPLIVTSLALLRAAGGVLEGKHREGA
jgi:hypothetical protein